MFFVMRNNTDFEHKVIFIMAFDPLNDLKLQNNLRNEFLMLKLAEKVVLHMILGIIVNKLHWPLAIPAAILDFAIFLRLLKVTCLLPTIYVSWRYHECKIHWEKGS